ncbi:MAG: sulfite exporter TauE/SafE family protein [Lawsonibacter sp.]|nr:sulfite exporter TauE/SafE family protein [Lawsonibacter sp.]
MVGLLIISLGGSGGAVYVWILTVFFHIPPGIAASTSLATTIPTTAVGTFSHWKAGNVNWRFDSPCCLAAWSARLLVPCARACCRRTCITR